MPQIVTVKLQVHQISERPLIRYADERFIVWDQHGNAYIAYFYRNIGPDGTLCYCFDENKNLLKPVPNPVLWARVPLARDIRSQFELGFGEEKEIGSE